MHLKLFLKLKWTLKTLSFRLIYKKTKNKKTNKKNPHSWFFFKPGFSQPCLGRVRAQLLHVGFQKAAPHHEQDLILKQQEEKYDKHCRTLLFCCSRCPIPVFWLKYCGIPRPTVPAIEPPLCARWPPPPRPSFENILWSRGRTCLVVDLVIGKAAGQQLVENYAESVHVALECVGAVVHHAYHCGHHTKRDVILKGLSREIDFINF